MTAQLLPTAVLFRRPIEGVRAAHLLWERGFGPVAIQPLSDLDLSILPVSRQESAARRNIMMAAAFAAFLGMGAVGWFVGNALNHGLGVLAMPSLAFLGMISALLIADRPPKRYRELRRLGAVLLTVRCPKEHWEQLTKTLLGADAMEVDRPPLLCSEDCKGQPPAPGERQAKPQISPVRS